ncbi:MAG: helix-turn-helix domain-containing protein [Verrucomicrobiae bacterium]
MDTPDFFIGARLAAARAKAGISLEKAAQDTRIRASQIRQLEADDFSGFAHPTYARLFLLDYAGYLGIPQDEIRPLLPDRAGAAPGGFQYIDALAADLPAMAKPTRRRRFRILVVFLSAVLLFLLLIAAIFTYFAIKRIDRIARSKPVAGQAAAPGSDRELLPGTTPPVPAPPDSSSVETFEPETSAAATPPTNLAP